VFVETCSSKAWQLNVLAISVLNLRILIFRFSVASRACLSFSSISLRSPSTRSGQNRSTISETEERVLYKRLTLAPFLIIEPHKASLATSFFSLIDSSSSNSDVHPVVANSTVERLDSPRSLVNWDNCCNAPLCFRLLRMLWRYNIRDNLSLKKVPVARSLAIWLNRPEPVLKLQPGVSIRSISRSSNLKLKSQIPDVSEIQIRGPVLKDG
jgi:hypothetical protein